MLPATHGETVSEVLGNGDASASGFVAGRLHLHPFDRRRGGRRSDSLNDLPGMKCDAFPTRAARTQHD
jgi:hypothetical protein